MTEDEITEALGVRLLATSGIPAVVWDNKAAAPSLPYVRAEVVFVGATDRTLAGGTEVKTGFLMASIIGKLDEFTTPGLALARAIADQFPYGLRLSGVLIYKPSEVLRGYRDEPNWRTPVRVSFRAY